MQCILHSCCSTEIAENSRQGNSFRTHEGCTCMNSSHETCLHDFKLAIINTYSCFMVVLWCIWIEVVMKHILEVENILEY